MVPLFLLQPPGPVLRKLEQWLLVGQSMVCKTKKELAIPDPRPGTGVSPPHQFKRGEPHSGTDNAAAMLQAMGSTRVHFIPIVVQILANLFF